VRPLEGGYDAWRERGFSGRARGKSINGDRRLSHPFEKLCHAAANLERSAQPIRVWGVQSFLIVGNGNCRFDPGPHTGRPRAAAVF